MKSCSSHQMGYEPMCSECAKVNGLGELEVSPQERRLTQLVSDGVQRGMVHHEISVVTEYPHNMTREQWRHELAVRVLENMIRDSTRYDLFTPKERANLAYQEADSMLKEGGKNEL